MLALVRRRLAELAPVALLLGLYALLKAYALNPAAGDENIYFYMAERAAHGVLPYRDFFFAHPPIHLLPGALVAWVGAPLGALKALPMLAAGVAGIFVWRAARRHLGAVEAVVALAAFLFAHDLLRASSHYTGANVAVAFLAVGLDALLARRDRTAGAFLALAGLTAIYTVPIAVVLAAVRFAEDRRRGLDVVAVGLLVFAVVSGLGLALGGGAYVDQVFAYHLSKPGRDGAFASALAALAFHDPVLLWAPIPSAAALVLEVRRHLRARPASRAARRRGAGRRLDRAALAELWALPKVRAVIFAGAPLLGGALFLAALGRVYHFYFLLAFPSLALLAGHGYGAALRASAGAARALRAHAPAAGRAAGVAAVLVVLVLGADGVRAAGLHAEPWYPRLAGTTRTYHWRDAPLPAWVNRAVRAVLWRDTRVVGARTPGVLYYLWHESRSFDTAERLADVVRRRVPEGETIFGDSTSAPLVALLAGRRLALDEADTNFMRFASGMTPPAAFLARLDAHPPAAVLASPRRGFFTVPALRHWVERRYRVIAQMRDPYQGEYVLWGRR